MPAATDHLFRRLGVRQNEVAALDYRVNGFPGEMVVRGKDGSRFHRHHLRTWQEAFGLEFYLPPSCLCCAEFSGEMADVSFGSCWLSACEDQAAGTSLIVTRTQAGEDAVQQAAHLGLLKLAPQAMADLRNHYAAHLRLHKDHHPLIARLVPGSPRVRLVQTPSLKWNDRLVVVLRTLMVACGRFSLPRAVMRGIYLSYPGGLLRKVLKGLKKRVTRDFSGRPADGEQQ